MARNTDFTLTKEKAELYREDLKKARPYTDEDPEPSYFDYIEDDDRSNATIAMELLKAAGLWTEEDERIAFRPHPSKKK